MIKGRKAIFSKLFLKYKIDTKTVIEAEHKARTDPEYKKIIESNAITIPGRTIKRLGSYTAKIRLHREVSIEYNFDVIPEKK